MKKLSEYDHLITNLDLYPKMCEYVKGAIECYFLLLRQGDKIIIDENKCFKLLQYLTICRYTIGEIIEEIRIHEKNHNDMVFN